MELILPSAVHTGVVAPVNLLVSLSDIVLIGSNSGSLYDNTQTHSTSVQLSTVRHWIILADVRYDIHTYKMILALSSDFTVMYVCSYHTCGNL